MRYLSRYSSPLGEILLAADDHALTGLWFVGQKHFPAFSENTAQFAETALLLAAKAWLEDYFSGKPTDFTPPLAPDGTPFQQRVWAALTTIPCGQTVTYGRLAQKLGCKSARAVGGAVGKNPISILIPCHRVVGAEGLTGYAGGLERKKALLALEQLHR